MVCFKHSFVFVFIFVAMASVLLSGCAVSGCGNPVNTHTVDSNNDIGYIHEEQNVIVNYPERKQVQQKPRVKRSGIKGKYSEYL